MGEGEQVCLVWFGTYVFRAELRGWERESRYVWFGLVPMFLELS